jgi:hypothetical protein
MYLCPEERALDQPLLVGSRVPRQLREKPRVSIGLRGSVAAVVGRGRGWDVHHGGGRREDERGQRREGQRQCVAAAPRSAGLS